MSVNEIQLIEVIHMLELDSISIMSSLTHHLPAKLRCGTTNIIVFELISALPEGSHSVTLQ